MRSLLPALFAAALATAPAWAQPMNHGAMGGMDHVPATVPVMPTEPGQSAFAAIQEIVDILQHDRATDWSKVDIEALRQHLIDMDNVTLRAEVTMREENGSLRFSASGEGKVRDSIRRMLRAHAATMNGTDGLKFVAANTPEGAEPIFTPAEPAQLVKLKALGLIGLLTLGMHHQMHHLMIARGAAPHE